MNGMVYRKIIEQETRLGPAEIARRLGTSTQALASLWKSDDIKSSYIDKAITCLGISPLAFFDSGVSTDDDNKNDSPVKPDNCDSYSYNMERVHIILEKQQDMIAKQQSQCDALISFITAHFSSHYNRRPADDDIARFNEKYADPQKNIS